MEPTRMMAILTTRNPFLTDQGKDMNSNQRSEANNQSNNGGNALAESSSRAFSTSKRADRDGAHQSGVQQSGATRGGSAGGARSTDRAGSQTGTVNQGLPSGHDSNDVAGGMPINPGGHHLAADQKMDDDTGLSNTANQEPSGLDQNDRQERQSNVGRRSDGTPD
jgi:hypothetical protein